MMTEQIYFEQAEGRLLDALTEYDCDDPNFGPPERWPWWSDCENWELGPDPVGPVPDDPDDDAKVGTDDVDDVDDVEAVPE